MKRLPAPKLAGDRWRLTVRLKRPHGVLNPHGFDLELWLFERGIGATGSVRPGAQWLGASLEHPVARLRQHARDAILMRVADPAAAGVLAALAVGDQAAIERDDWDIFRLTGVAHLMSISGLHVTAFAWLAGVLIGALWRRWPAAIHAVPVPVAALPWTCSEARRPTAAPSAPSSTSPTRSWRSLRHSSGWQYA